jgi:salicylate hydroxylase
MPPFFFIGHNYSMKDYSNHIGIIGAGISGLALGSILKTNNIPCVIFEKSNNISEYGAGISISSNGMRVLENLGISENLKATSGRPSQATFYSNNSEITKIPVDVITTSRKNLYKVLLDKYLSLDGDIHFNYELSNLDLKNKKIYFTNNDKCNVKHIAACDGIKSTCQKYSTLSKHKPQYSGYSIWRAILSSHQDDINFYLGPNFHIVSYPIDSHRISFVAAIKNTKQTNESWKEKGSADELQTKLPSAIVNRYSLLRDSKDIYRWGVYIRPKIETLFDNNITFIGDSAHPIVPFMGQGGCLALEDAYAFGNLLYRNNSNFRETQNRYQQLRINRIKTIHIQSLNQAKLNHLSNPILIFFRNLLMKYTGVISNRTKNIWSYDIIKEVDSNDFK